MGNKKDPPQAQEMAASQSPDAGLPPGDSEAGYNQRIPLRPLPSELDTFLNYIRVEKGLATNSISLSLIHI